MRYYPLNKWKLTGAVVLFAFTFDTPGEAIEHGKRAASFIGDQTHEGYVEGKDYNDCVLNSIKKGEEKCRNQKQQKG